MPRRSPGTPTYQKNLEARIDRMRARVLILTGPDKFRPATRAEFVRLALEYTVREQERGQPILRETRLRFLRNARQTDGGSPRAYNITTAELASLATYPALERLGRKPTAAERALFRTDAAVLAVGCGVKVRGTLFSGRKLAPARVGNPYLVMTLPERGAWCTVGLPGRLEFRVHRWDLAPLEYLDPPRRTRF